MTLLNRSYILISIVSISYIFVCCNTNKTNYINILSNDSLKYWEFIGENEKLKFYGVCIHKNNVYEMYTNQVDGTRFYSCPYYQTIWKIVNDSTMMFGEDFYYKIISMNSDTVRLISLKNKKMFILSKEFNQIKQIFQDTTKYPFPKM